MALYTTTSNTRGIQPDNFGPLVVQPFMVESVAARVATTVTTRSNRYRIPLVTAETTPAFVAEGARIPVTDPTLTELTVTPAKLASLIIVVP